MSAWSHTGPKKKRLGGVCHWRRSGEKEEFCVVLVVTRYKFTHRPVNKLRNTPVIWADNSHCHIVCLKRFHIRSSGPGDICGNLVPPDLLVFCAAVKLKRDGVWAFVPIGQLEPAVRYHGNVAHAAARNAWHLDANGVVFQFALRPHLEGRLSSRLHAEQFGSNHHVNCSEPMNHERTILSRSPFLRWSEIRLDRKPKLLEINAAFSAKCEHMRSLTVARHRECAKPQHIVIVHKAFESALHVAVLIVEVRVQEAGLPVRLLGSGNVLGQEVSTCRLL